MTSKLKAKKLISINTTMGYVRLDGTFSIMDVFLLIITLDLISKLGEEMIFIELFFLTDAAHYSEQKICIGNVCFRCFLVNLAELSTSSTLGIFFM